MAFNEKITKEAYYAASDDGSRISFHALLDFARDGSAYHRKITGEEPPEEETRAMLIGSATHALVLEGEDTFRRRYQISDGPLDENGKPYSKLTKAYKEWAAKQTLPTFSCEEGGIIRAMKNAVYGIDPRTGEPCAAAKLLAKGRPEIIVRFDYCGLPCQSMLDWVNPAYGEVGGEPRGAIIDLKTTADLDKFHWQARDARYIHQLAFYRSAVAISTGALMDCYIIAVEKALHPRVGVFAIDTADLDEAARWNEQRLAELRDARDNSMWLTGYEDIRTLTLKG